MLTSVIQKFMIATLLTLFACVAVGEEERDVDPLEPMNRKLFSFHKWFDEHFFRPAAVSYRAVVPPKVRYAVSNFFSNVDHIPMTVNNVLQLEPRYAYRSGTRFVINSTLGIGGLFDVATPLGFEYRKADLGQTFAVWGWQNSTYIFIPLFGPSTVRDGIGVVGDIYMTPWPYMYDAAAWSSAVLYGIDQRSKFMDTEAVLQIAALDEYSFIRDGFLQHRYIFIHGESLNTYEDASYGDIL